MQFLIYIFLLPFLQICNFILSLKIYYYSINCFSSFFFIFKGNLNKCSTMKQTKKIFTDECNRQCACVNGRLTNCYRVRKQFSKLTLKQRLHYSKVYKALFTHKTFNQTFLDMLSVHPSLDFHLLHGKEQILPFHRK